MNEMSSSSYIYIYILPCKAGFAIFCSIFSSCLSMLTALPRRTLFCFVFAYNGGSNRPVLGDGRGYFILYKLSSQSFLYAQGLIVAAAVRWLAPLWALKPFIVIPLIHLFFFYFCFSSLPDEAQLCRYIFQFVVCPNHNPRVGCRHSRVWEKMQCFIRPCQTRWD